MTGSAKNQNAVLAEFSDGKRLSNLQLQSLTNLGQRQIMRAAGSLVKRGLLQREEQGVFSATEAGLNAIEAGLEITSGPAGPSETVRAPFSASLRQSVWSAMRVMQVFSTADIVSVACDDPSVQDHENIRRYLRALRDAGFLFDMPTRQLGASASSNGFKRYRLFRNTGEIAPTYRNTKREVYDHNTREVFPCQV